MGQWFFLCRIFEKDESWSMGRGDRDGHLLSNSLSQHTRLPKIIIFLHEDISFRLSKRGKETTSCPRCVHRFYALRRFVSPRARGEIVITRSSYIDQVVQRWSSRYVKFYCTARCSPQHSNKINLLSHRVGTGTVYLLAIPQGLRT